MALEKFEGYEILNVGWDELQVISEPVPDPLTIDYHSSHMVRFKPFQARGWTEIDVLPELIGKKWGPIPLGLCHVVRPSSIRVTTGETKCDASTWRLTVYVDKDDIIQSLHQEVEFGGTDEVGSGYEMSEWLVKK